MGFLSKLSLTLSISWLFSFPCYSQSEDSYEYERSSVHIMMIRHLNQRYEEIVEEVFMASPFPERFNDHNLGVKTVAFAEIDGNQQKNIESFIDQVNLGQKLVSKWFNRDKNTGSFNMELIKSRGFYNSTQSQLNQARASIRGLALLADAGENLIKNTYLIVNDISYKSKGNSAWLLKTIANAYVGNLKGTQSGLTGIGGFNVDITSYLFRLKWDEEIANTFYTNYYTEDGQKDKDKVVAFAADKNLFKMEYVGKIRNISSETNFRAAKDPKELLIKVCTRTMDLNIAQLQHQYPDFRIKAPLLSTDPLKADVGMKEDITEKSRFEVLERVMDDNGHISYERVGIIKPVPNKIKDNRYMVTDEELNKSSLDATEFQIVSGKDFYPGMFIREIE